MTVSSILPEWHNIMTNTQGSFKIAKLYEFFMFQRVTWLVHSFNDNTILLSEKDHHIIIL